MTPAGIEPATFQFVAQHLNHCATTVPSSSSSNVEYSIVFCLDGHYRNDDGLVKPKMGLQNNKVMN